VLKLNFGVTPTSPAIHHANLTAKDVENRRLRVGINSTRQIWVTSWMRGY
jgi:hypothetical protein